MKTQIEISFNYGGWHIINYDVEEKIAGVLIRNWWKKPVRDDVLDHLLRSFKVRGWERTDTTDVSDLKELMHKTHVN